MNSPKIDSKIHSIIKEVTQPNKKLISINTNFTEEELVGLWMRIKS
jgi:hypothetical protein